MDALKAEIDEIERELAADPRQAKLRSLREVLALYDVSGEARDGWAPVAENSPVAPRTVTRAPSEARSKAMELAEFFLRNRAGPTPTREILDYIVMFGGEVGGKDPVSNLSAMLSNSGLFQSHGRAGWTITDPDVKTIDGQTVSDVVQSVMADLTSDDILHAHSWHETNHKIPQDLDGKLLSETRRRIDRHLTDGEMRSLRGAFINALRSAVLV
ncbi:MAG: hypothetical protein M9955_07850 [Rhizobiaceae bacterium]|nr:hypothetical protein [Rhizobiaceae bacterium]